MGTGNSSEFHNINSISKIPNVLAFINCTQWVIREVNVTYQTEKRKHEDPITPLSMTIELNDLELESNVTD